MTLREIDKPAIPTSFVRYRSLLWTVPFILLWTWLTTSLPVLLDGGFPTLALRLIVLVLITLGLWLGLERTALSFDQRRNTWLAISIPFILWAALAWTGAMTGGFRFEASPLPLLPMAIFLPVLIGAPLLLFSKRVGTLLDAMPATWLIALQLYRIFGSQWLVFWLLGRLPGLWALPAGTGDVLTGLFAVPASMALATATMKGRNTAILWNVFGLLDLAIAITLGMLFSPGPFQYFTSIGPNIGLDTYPNVLTPAFVVPSSILLHALSLRQLRRRRQANAPQSVRTIDQINLP